MYKQNWTAYPAGRLTRTCPMPTRPLPPTAKTHEDQHTSPRSTSLLFHLSHPLPLLPFIPLLLPSAPSQRCRGTKREAGEKERWRHGFCSSLYFTLLKEKNSPSLPLLFLLQLILFHHFSLALFPSWLLHWGRVFVTVTYKTVCYMRVHGYGGPMWM